MVVGIIVAHVAVAFSVHMYVALIMFVLPLAGNVFLMFKIAEARGQRYAREKIARLAPWTILSLCWMISYLLASFWFHLRGCCLGCELIPWQRSKIMTAGCGSCQVSFLVKVAASVLLLGYIRSLSFRMREHQRGN